MPLTQEDVDQLECHFKWKPEEGDVDGDPEATIEHLLKHFDENPDIKLLSLAVIGYLYAKMTPPQYEKAISICDDVVKACMEVEKELYDEYKGYELVALHNKINILWLLKEQEEAEDLFKAVFSFETLSDKGRATVYGCHGYALALFGRTKFKKSIEMYEKAVDLNPEDYRWHVGVAFATGRKRRVEEGTASYPERIEITILERAIELSKEKKSIPIVLLADLYFVQGRNFHNKGIVGDPRMMTKAKIHYEKAFALDPHAPHVIKRCGKAFHLMGDEVRGLSCLLEAVKLDPYSSMNLHRLGQAYEKGKVVKNLKKAEENCAKAVTAGRRRNFYAEVDLGRIRNKMDSKYDLEKHYEDMKAHYVLDEDRMTQLERFLEDERKGKGRRGRKGRY